MQLQCMRPTYFYIMYIYLIVIWLLKTYMQFPGHSGTADEAWYIVFAKIAVLQGDVVH